MKSLLLPLLLFFHSALLAAPSIQLTEKEQQWINTTPAIRYVYDPDWAPFEWTNEIGQHTGIILDILKLIETRSGLHFTPIHTNNWLESTNLAQNRHADMYSAVGSSEQRKNYMTFSTAPIFSTNYIFVSRKNEDFSLGFKKLENKILAVVDNYTIHKVLKKNHPEIPLTLVKTVTQGLNQLVDNKIDVLVINAATGNYLLGTNAYQSLKNAFETNLKLDLYITIRNDWPNEAISIINKALNTISDEESQAVYTKWTEARKIDYSLLIQVSLSLTLFILLFIFLNRKQAKFIQKIKQQKNIIQNSLDTQKELEEKTQLLLASIAEGIFGVDNNGKVTFINPAALNILQYTENEILGENIHQLIHHSHSDGSTYAFEKCPMYLAFHENKITQHNDQIFWKKDGSHFPINYNARPLLKNKQLIGAVVTFSDKSAELIAKQKLIDEVANRKQSELLAEHAKNKLENITNSIPGVVYQLQIVKNKITANFISHGIKQLHDISPEHIIKDFDLFINSIHSDDQQAFIKTLTQDCQQLQNINFEYRALSSDKKIKWIRMEATATETSDEQDKILLFDKENDSKRSIILNGSLIDITAAKIAHEKTIAQQHEIKQIYKKTQESIEYAALIQGALIPDHRLFHAHFKDFFAIWKPKDTVSGDIYFLEEINEDEVVLMLIDCTGHGIPGAFVTMLVKAIEVQLLTNLQQEKSISPAKILSYFNQQIKYILKQDHEDSISDAGFDGAIIHYHKSQKLIKFSGANIPLFINQNDEFTLIKGDRQSVGYKKSKPNFNFTEHSIDVSNTTHIYLSTDGFFDQTGGDKGFPYGKIRFNQFLEKNVHETLADQQELFLYELQNYQKGAERNDDITVIGLKI